jgi:DNA-binding NtrC family response regulator
MSIIFQSRSMQRVLEQARCFARTSVTVLICGESGTGKELLARLIHQQSPRQTAPYLRLNCGAWSTSLIESELFGHEAGAYTGAVERRHGPFERVGTGTLFLDEIGELPLSAQSKLLRILEEREFQRVGGDDVLTFAGRLVAATNRNLEKEAQRGSFRHDLLHRLNVLPLPVPALRERREDIPALVNYFVHQCQSELERPVRGVTRPVMKQLCDYDWPGNVRELKNVILRFCVLAHSDMVEQIELPSPSAAEDEADELVERFSRLSLEEIERQIILERLRCYAGNRTEAAAALGVTPRTLRNKLSHYRKLGYVT